MKKRSDKPDLEDIGSEEFLPYPLPIVHDPQDRIISYDDFGLDEYRVKLIFKNKRKRP